MPRYPIEVENLLYYVDDEPLLCNNKNDHEKLMQESYAHFLKFGLKMHVGTGTENSKMVAIYFLPTLDETTQHTKLNRLPSNITINEGKIFGHFVKNFKYLGTYIARGRF